MKIVIANSVGIDKHGYRMIHYPSRWTTGVKRAYFAWYPWQLAYASALLKRETSHAVKLIDGCREQLDFERYLERISAERPDILVMESSTRTIEEDLRLALAVRERFGTRLIFTGQHASAYPKELAEKADYVCQGEYEFTVLDIVQGKPREEIPGLYPNRLREPFDVNLLPWPEDDDISRMAYAEPGPPGLRYRQVQAYASRGCPFRCAFCVSSNLYYSTPNWRPRNPDDVVNEIIHLRKKYPRMEGVFFDEEAHNLRRGHVIDLCRRIIDAGLNDLHYTGMCMYSTLDDEVLEWMQKAGYYQLRIGIETASAQAADGIGMQGKFALGRLHGLLETAKRLGIDIFGTFTIGALGSNETEDLKTVELIRDLLKKELICELQVSISTPQPGTPFFTHAERNGLLVTRDWRRFDGTTESVVSYPHYPKGRIEHVFRLAVDVGHYYRGRISMKEEGIAATLVKALKKRGVAGSVRLMFRHLLGRV